ncbi:MAG: glycosyltransferase [Bacteroidota bacterium]
MIPKWYPYQEDPQFGVFIQKHAEAIAIDDKVMVIFAHSVAGLPEKFHFDILQKNNLLEIIISFRKNESLFGNLINGIRYFSAIRKGISKGESFFKNPDLIHAYVLLRTAVVAYYLSFIFKKPYVVNEQWSGYATGKFQEGSFFKKAITKFLVKKSSGLISVSDFLLDKMHECGISNSNEKVIPNSIEVVKEPEPSKQEKVNVLLVADLVDEIKNIGAVIRSVAIAKDQFPNFELRIIGHGKDKEKLIETARELGVLNTHVIFEGLKSNPEVYGYLQKSDFLVMNSRFETFSLICCEAMSCGKPVLATRCGGPEEFIDQEVGILIGVDDDAQLAEKLLFMLNNFRAFDSHTIISKVKNRFSKETVKKLYSDFFGLVTE